MSERRSSKSLSIWLQILSLFGLGLIPLIVLRTMIDSPGLHSQPQIVGSIFIVICLLGAIVGVRPSSFSKSKTLNSSQVEIVDSQETELHKQEPAHQGHHYSCDSFSSHVLKVGGGVYCAGCTGLTTGAIIAIFGSLVYFFIGIPLFNEHIVFWFGFSGVLIGLVQHRIYRKLSISSGFVRFSFNVIFVLGAFFLLVGANQITGYLSVDFFIICVVLLWILNRIVMSKAEHQWICEQCSDISCIHTLY